MKTVYTYVLVLKTITKIIDVLNILYYYCYFLLGQYYDGQAEKIDDYTYHLTNANLHATNGDTVEVKFQAHFDFMLPLVVKEVMNGVQLCGKS